jgi:hypothetical protein
MPHALCVDVVSSRARPTVVIQTTTTIAAPWILAPEREDGNFGKAAAIATMVVHFARRVGPSARECGIGWTKCAGLGGLFECARQFLTRFFGLPLAVPERGIEPVLFHQLGM